jgi:hypothetical protein
MPKVTPLWYRLAQYLDRPIAREFFWFIVLPARFRAWAIKESKVKHTR